MSHSDVHPIGEHMVVRTDGQRRWVACVTCDREYGPSDRDPKLGSVMKEVPITDLSPLNRYGLVEEIVVRQFYCPGCGTMIGANVQRVGDPIMLETKLSG